ncbi:MAG: hypothetical protein ACE14O_05590 [Candidatus Cloacimonadaceae bacterium]
MNKKSRPQIRYSEKFKRMVVEDIESHIMNITQAMSNFSAKILL